MHSDVSSIIEHIVNVIMSNNISNNTRNRASRIGVQFPSSGAAAARSRAQEVDEPMQEVEEPMPPLLPINPPSSPSQRAGAIVRNVNVANAARSSARAIMQRFSPLRQEQPVENVGASPFGLSIAESDVTAPTASSPGDVPIETPEQIKAWAVEDNAGKGGDGGDSDEEGLEVLDHLLCVREHELEQSVRDEANGIESWYEDGEEMATTTTIPTSDIPGSPPGWFPFSPPATHSEYNKPKPGSSGAPEDFMDVDNPGSYCDFTFQAKYDSAKKYKGHYTPAGAKVVPQDDNGQRTMNGHTFYYDGWVPSEFDKSTYVRGSATRDNLKPPDRKGSLDADAMKKMGMNKSRMNEPLFFLQLLLPIHNPKNSGIQDDGRMPFFTVASSCTNIYALVEGGKGGGYGHKWTNVDEAELVRWVGVPIRNGARNGSPGSIHERWLPEEEDYDQFIANAMTYTRYRELKSVFKLNNNVASPPRGQDGYDPASKYDLIYQVVTHNMNLLTKSAELDCTVDESTWGFSGYCGDAGGRLKNKPFNKG